MAASPRKPPIDDKLMMQPPWSRIQARHASWLHTNAPRTFTWKVTPVRAGTYSIRYRVAVGLYGKANAVDTTTGTTPKGSFIARVSREPRPAPRVVPEQRGGAA